MDNRESEEAKEPEGRRQERAQRQEKQEGSLSPFVLAGNIHTY